MICQSKELIAGWGRNVFKYSSGKIFNDVCYLKGLILRLLSVIVIYFNKLNPIYMFHFISCFLEVSFKG